MAKENNKRIPVYGIDRFSRGPNKKIEYQVEIFDNTRNFKVTYPHRHDDFYEILYITNGTGYYTIDLYPFEIFPGAVFFLSPGQVHELVLSDDIKGYIFLFSSTFYHFNKSNPFKIFELPFFYTISPNSPHLILKSDIQKNLVSDLFLKAISESENELIEKDDAIRALLDLILISCKRMFQELPEEGSLKGLVLVKRFKQLIESNCNQNMSVKDFAELLKITPSHLSETVKNITGRTSTDLINDRTIIEIKRMLLQTDLSISEIGYKLNFSDQSYFSKYFKKLTGVTPQHFRSVKL
ncbi:MAG: helix-turn-helix domain-containing protein [Opitutaceae bacterium]|nr:helix-turn-helix domain-containing protein [Cytophagales bacterium]